MKIVTVLGARPQFIKASVVSLAMAQTTGLQEVLVHTGQHFDANMSDVFFAELGMKKPDYFLDIHGGGHGAMTGRMLIEIEKVLQHERPDAVLVYGDTNSTLAGALAAAKLHIPVAHVEAGLRSFNMAMPEEINRILTDHVSRWLFTPTKTSANNLAREGFSSEQIIPTGDVMYDMAIYHGHRVQAETGLMEKLKLKTKKYVLVTVHRAENTDYPKRLSAIATALEMLSTKIRVVWPLHPRTRKILIQEGFYEELAKRVSLIDPVSYLDMVQLEKFSALIATDSGGIQKEAFFYSVPCVTLRNETEWTELVESGWNKLSPPNSSKDIFDAIIESLGTQGKEIYPYGVGNASKIIAQQLLAS